MKLYIPVLIPDSTSTRDLSLITIYPIVNNSYFTLEKVQRVKDDRLESMMVDTSLMEALQMINPPTLEVNEFASLRGEA